MKKVVLKLDVPDHKAKIKVMKTVSSLAGVDSISLDMKDQKLTVTGDTDPVIIVSKLRKLCQAEIVAVGPAKEEKKKEEPKKEEPKKQEDQKKDKKDQKAENNIPVAYYAYPPVSQYPSMSQQPPYYFSDENPNACVIS